MSINQFQITNLSPSAPYINGMHVNYESNNIVLVSPGSCSLSDRNGNRFNLSISNTLIFNTQIIGAGGLDTALDPTPRALIGLYIIADSSGFNPPALLGKALSAGSTLLTVDPVPFLPAGYDCYLLRYYLHLDSAFNIIHFFMSGEGAYYSNLFSDGIIIVNTGVSASPVLINVLPYVPAQKAQLYLQVSFTAPAAADSVFITSGDNFATQTIPVRKAAGPGSSIESVYQVSSGYDSTFGSWAIRYHVSVLGSATTIYLSGYQVGLLL